MENVNIHEESFQKLHLETYKKNTCKHDSKVAVITIAFITSIAVGIIGTLVYTGVLHAGLSGVGAMTMATGLYTLLAGFGATFILTILVTVVSLLNRAKHAAQGDSEKTSCFQTKKTKINQNELI